MLHLKRHADESTTFSTEFKRTFGGDGETSGPLISDSDFDQHALSGLSDEVLSSMSKVVVSVALCKGHRVLLACSAVAMDNKTMLTSARLAVAFGKATKRRDDVVIKVRHEGDVVIGTLEGYDLKYEVAIVKVSFSLDCLVRFNHDVELLPNTEVVAVGRNASGQLICTSGILTATFAEDGQCALFSTCKLSEELPGGALFDLSGNFMGMNLFPIMDGSIFLPRLILVERLEHLRTSEFRRSFRELLGAARSAERITDATRSQFGYSLGYPQASLDIIKRGMVLVNTFEETFGDVYPGGVWAAFKKRVASNIFRNVVALSSFDGDTRVFACTGFFINFDDKCSTEKCSTVLTSASLVRCHDGGKMVEGLTIKVLLPNKRCCVGTLQHYSLQYNVALVSVKDFHAVRPANLEHKWIDLSSTFVSVGRCYESGILMAAKGVRSDRTGVHTILEYSTCKTTMAAIGGPLLDINGNFIGMNFYDQLIGAPFLMCDDLCAVLQYFKTKEKNYQQIFGPWKCILEDVGQIKWWPVPTPFWCDPKELEVLENEEDSMDEYERALKANGIPYRYVGGDIIVLK